MSPVSSSFLKTGVKAVTDRTDAFHKAVTQLTSVDVLVGIPADRAGREDNEEGQPLNNAEIGYIQEHGAPDANIPPRPHMIPGVKEAKAEIVSYFSGAAKAAMLGRKEAMMRNLHAAGIAAENKIKGIIRARIPPPLAESTIAKRIARGRTGTVPLWDTGTYLRAITHVIRDRK